MDKPRFRSNDPLLTDADDRRKPRQMWPEARAQVDGYDDLGDMPSVPRDFVPRPTAPMQLVDEDPFEPWTWRHWIGPVLLVVALVGAVASCAFGGR